MLKPVLVAFAVGLLAGCMAVGGHGPGEAPPSHNLPANGGESCAEADYAYLIGQKEAEIDRSRLPKLFRIACHNCPVTADYNAARLTIALGPDRRVASARCG
jgi:hypothetical protein